MRVGNYSVFTGGYNEDNNSMIETHSFDKNLVRKYVVNMSHYSKYHTSTSIGKYGIIAGGLHYSANNVYNAETYIHDTSLGINIPKDSIYSFDGELEQIATSAYVLNKISPINGYR